MISLMLLQETPHTQSPLRRAIERSTIEQGLPPLSDEAIVDTMLKEAESLFQQATGRRSSRQGVLGRRGMSFILSCLCNEESVPTYSTLVTVEMQQGQVTFADFCHLLCKAPWTALFSREIQQYAGHFEEYLTKEEQNDRRKAVKEKLMLPVRKKHEIALQKKAEGKETWRKMKSFSFQDVANPRQDPETESEREEDTAFEEDGTEINERNERTEEQAPLSHDTDDSKDPVLKRDDRIVSPRTAARLEQAYKEQKEFRNNVKASWDKVRKRPWGLGIGSAGN